MWSDVLPWIVAALSTAGIILTWRGLEGKARERRQRRAYERGRQDGLLSETVRRLDNHIDEDARVHRDLFAKIETMGQAVAEVRGGVRKLLNGRSTP